MSDTIHSFGPGGWGRVAHPLDAKERDVIDYDESMLRAGFLQVHDFGGQHSDVRLIVREGRDYVYLAEWEMGGNITSILIADLPSLFKFLGEALPVVRNALAISQAAERQQAVNDREVARIEKDLASAHRKREKHP